MRGTEIADIKLCSLAKSIREKFDDDLFVKKAIRFLAYVNQSDWEANCILKLIKNVILDGSNLATQISRFQREFNQKNADYESAGKPLIPQNSLDRLIAMQTISPNEYAIVTAAENWVILTQKDNGRYPNDNEWHRFLTSPLDGKIGMSFALQWRYNFGVLFNAENTI